MIDGIFRTMTTACALVLLGGAAVGDTVSGTVQDAGGDPLAGIFATLMDEHYAPLAYGNTDGEGAFSFERPPEARFLILMPPRSNHGPGVHSFFWHPRVFDITDVGDALTLTLPHAVSFILHGYDADGKLLLWEDYMAMGSLGGQFIHATNLDFDSIAATRWHIPRPDAVVGDDSRERSLPVVILEPGAPAALELLFWDTQDYGKLLVRMDNEGLGYNREAPGAHMVLEVNIELARTAVADLVRRADHFLPEEQSAIGSLVQDLRDARGLGTPEDRAAAADSVLAAALRLRDDLELARARRTAEAARNGTLVVQLPDTRADGGETHYTITPLGHDFLFGVYEGAPYHRQAWETAREAGFDLATVLLGWNWTQQPDRNKGAIERQYGINALEDLGYRLKSHGVVWVQEYPIMPERAATMLHETLKDNKLSHAGEVLDVFGERLHILESINEPANTNVVGLSREDMAELAARAAKVMKERGRPVLVNSPHEFTHGWQFVNYTPDGKPVDHFPRSFSAFLEEAAANKQLDDVDIIGLQVYPGGHFRTPPFDGLDTPAYTPSRLLDLLDRYSRFGKTLHITEFSLPSRYEPEWRCGYWRGEWTEDLQAAYVEAVFAIAYAHPQVRSISWWDISDLKPSVAHGGLLREDGGKKPAFEAIEDLIAAARGPREGSLDGATSEISLPGGRYALTVEAPDGTSHTTEFQLLEGFRKVVEIP